jgi:hypothetical protein
MLHMFTKYMPGTWIASAPAVLFSSIIIYLISVMHSAEVSEWWGFTAPPNPIGWYRLNKPWLHHWCFSFSFIACFTGFLCYGYLVEYSEFGCQQFIFSISSDVKWTTSLGYFKNRKRNIFCGNKIELSFPSIHYALLHYRATNRLLIVAIPLSFIQEYNE